MTIQLTDARVINGSVQATGTQHTLSADFEAYLVQNGFATWVGGAPDVGGDTGVTTWRRNADGLVSLVGQDGPISTLGNAVTVGPGGQYTDIQSAIDSITDNLPVSYNAGTVSVTNGSAQITFSSAPAADKVVAGRDLFSVDGSRYYRIKSGPTTAGGATFNLFEVYQGSTNAAASFSIFKPNPRTVLLLPGVYDYTDVALARNVLSKPYVGIRGLDRDSCIIRRNKNNPTPAATPVVGLAHGSWLDNLTIDAVDGHFDFYRMGLTAKATSQTQAMAGSKWELRNVALLNKDPNGIDTGADYLIDLSYYNGDELLMERCYYEHCWDGFTFDTSGAGRLLVSVINPTVYKTPTPLSLNASSACLIRAGISGTSTTDVVIAEPYYNQEKLCAGEVFNDGFGGFIANTGGVSGLLGIGTGATGKVSNPTILCDYGLNYGHCGGVVALGTAAATLEVVGGKMSVKGLGAPGSKVGGVVCNANGTTNISHCDIDADNAGVINANASSTVNVRAGARVKGTTNSINCSAGTVNVSANADLIGATTGAGTINLATAT